MDIMNALRVGAFLAALGTLAAVHNCSPRMNPSESLRKYLSTFNADRVFIVSPSVVYPPGFSEQVSDLVKKITEKGAIVEQRRVMASLLTGPNKLESRVGEPLNLIYVGEVDRGKARRLEDTYRGEGVLTQSYHLTLNEEGKLEVRKLIYH